MDSLSMEAREKLSKVGGSSSGGGSSSSGSSSRGDDGSRYII